MVVEEPVAPAATHSSGVPRSVLAVAFALALAAILEALAAAHALATFAGVVAALRFLRRRTAGAVDRGGLLGV